MSKRLTHNLNSAYFEAANRLRPSRARKRIVAYVESFDDVAFWRNILDEYEDDKLYFEIKLPSRNTLGKGKRQALMNLLGADNLGSAMIACVDADYDYLLQDTSEESIFINHSPYVIHTFVYAIESYQCWAPSLHRAVVTATLNDRPTLDFEAFMSEYSQIIWPLFVWNIWCYRNDKYKTFTMMDFCGFVSFRSVNTRRPEETLAQLKRRVNQKIAWLQRHFPEARKTYAPLRNELQQNLHLKPEETYLYIQGHTLFENVVAPLLEPVCAMLRKEREREIKELAMHTKQRQCELSSYQHSVMPIDVVLKKNTAFMEAPQMALVRERVENYLQEARQKLLTAGNAERNENDNPVPGRVAAHPSAFP
ncbi:MAG: DUF4435 domain-containing protein [Bacteroidales bacterium]|nr:DUF4435 domain-containing protein [Bacteroidales bacterium]